MGDYYDRLGVPITLQEWSELMQDDSYHRIACTLVGGRWWVSTVWLGLNHNLWGGPPLIYETMVFDHSPETRGLDQYRDLDQERYMTEDQARDGHEEMVRQVMLRHDTKERVDG